MNDLDFDTKLDLNQITSGFNGVIAMGGVYRQGTLTFRTPDSHNTVFHPYIFLNTWRDLDKRMTRDDKLLLELHVYTVKKDTYFKIQKELYVIRTLSKWQQILSIDTNILNKFMYILLIKHCTRNMTSLLRIGEHRLYVKETKVW